MPAYPDEWWLPLAAPVPELPAVARALAESRAIAAGEEALALREGRALIAAGETLEGEARLEEVARAGLSGRQRSAAALARGESLFRRGEAAAAAAAFEAALAGGSGERNWAAGFWHGAALAKAGDPGRAAAVLEASADSPELRAALLGPDAAAARRARSLALRWAGWLEANRGEIASARRLWRAALAAAGGRPGLADSLTLNLAEIHFAEGEWDSVAALLARPRDPQARDLRWDLLHGRACFELEDWAEADSLLARVTEHPGEPPRAWVDEALMVRGWIALKGGETEQALALYGQVSGERSGDLPLARYGAALAHLQEGRADEAEGLLAPGPPVAPGDPLHDRWAYGLAFARFVQARYAEALAALEPVGDGGAGGALAQAAWMLRGDAHYRMGRMEEAGAAYARAVAAGGESEELLRRQALAALGTERWGPAARIFGDLVRKFPATARAGEYRFWRGEALYRLGRLDEARAEYVRAENLGADRLSCVYASAWCSYRQDRFGEALKEFARAAMLCGGCPLASDIAIRRGNCLFNLGRLDESARAFAEAERSAGAAADTTGAGREAAFRSAWALLRLEDYAAAAEQFARVGGEGPSDELAARAVYWEGQAWLRAGDHAAAFDRFQLAAAHPQAPDTLRARAFLATGDAAYNLERPAEAIDWYRRVLESPGADGAMRRAAQESLFECRQLRGEWDEAREALDELTANYPDAVAGGDRHLQLADGFFRHGRYRDALQAYGDYLERARPDDGRQPEARYRMARAREALGQWREAAEAYAALGEVPDFHYAADALLRAGVLYLEGGDAQRALVSLERRLGLPLSPAGAGLTRAHLARAYEALGEKRAARNEWEKVAHGGGDIPDSLRAIGSFQLARNAFDNREWSAAFAAFRAADSLGLPGEIHRARYWAGESAFRLGSPREAARWLESFVAGGEQEPLWEATARMRLAECYESLERWDDAREQYETVTRMPLKMESLGEEARERLKKVAARKKS